MFVLCVGGPSVFKVTHGAISHGGVLTSSFVIMRPLSTENCCDGDEDGTEPSRVEPGRAG